MARTKNELRPHSVRLLLIEEALELFMLLLKAVVQRNDLQRLEGSAH